MREIGNTIRARRNALNITQQELASLAGVGINTLVAIERGVANPSYATLVSILDVLGLKLSVG